MAELLNLLFYPLSNGIMTVLTGMSLLYWVFMFFSGDGIDAGTDFHIGDVTDIDTAHDIETDGEVHGAPSVWSQILDYINIGKIPLMVVVTLFKFISWLLTIFSSLFLGIANWGIKSVFILIPVFIITYFIMHYLTKPLVKMYKNLGYNGEEAHDFLGRTGLLKSTIENDKIGILEVIINKDVIRLNVKSQNGKRIDFGSEVMIVKELNDKKTYEVIQNITIHNIN